MEALFSSDPQIDFHVSSIFIEVISCRCSSLLILPEGASWEATQLPTTSWQFPLYGLIC